MEDALSRYQILEECNSDDKHHKYNSWIVITKDTNV